MRSTKRFLLVALPAALLAGIVGMAFFSAQRALDGASRSLAAGSRAGFSVQTLDLSSPAGGNSGFEPVASANAFTCGAFLAGDLYLAGSAGLSVYAPDGSLRRTLRTGLELPVAPIVQLATARLRGASEPQLLLATAGAGLLLLSRDSQGGAALRQLLPAAAGARDLTAVLPLATGDVLLGTRNSGVFLFTGAELAPVRFSLPGTDPARLEVTSLAAAGAASYFIGTRFTGLFYLHGGSAEHADTSSGLPDNQVEAIAVANGKAFAGTPLGIAEFDLTPADSAAAFRPARVLAPGLFSRALALDARASQLTVGTFDQGIQQLRLDARAHLANASISIAAGPDSSDAPDRAADHPRIDQFLAQPNPSAPLYAIAGGVLLVRSPTGWTPALPAPAASATPALADRTISALAFDPNGRLFVGFFDHGLDVLPPGAGPNAIQHFEDDHLFCINRIVLDPARQTIAAATANGLVLFDRQGTPRQVLTRRDGLISDHVTDVAFTHAGTVLATPAGITFITPAGAESLYGFQGLVNNHVYALSGSPASDHLLAGTLGGLSVLDSAAVSRNFTVTNSGLRHNWITALAALPDGSQLVGTYGAGLLRLTTGKDRSSAFSPLDLPAGTPSDLVINPNALLATGTHIYAGTLGHGMLVYTTATGRWTAITRGLPSLNVTAFAARAGELYVGTENGLVRIAEERLP